MKDDTTFFFTAAGIAIEGEPEGILFSEEGVLDFLNEEAAQDSNGVALLTTLNLGKYCYEHTESLKEILNCYIAYDYLNNLENEFQSRLLHKKEKSIQQAKEELKKNFYQYIELNDLPKMTFNQKLDKFTIDKATYIKAKNPIVKKTFIKHLKEWLKTCGIEEDRIYYATKREIKEVKTNCAEDNCETKEDKTNCTENTCKNKEVIISRIENDCETKEVITSRIENNYETIEIITSRIESKCEIHMSYILMIITFCIHIYKFYKTVKENDTIPEGLEMDLTYITEKGAYILDKNPGELTFKITFKKLEHLLLFDMFTFERRSGKRLNLCPYCAILFLGRKDKKCCSTSCKEYFNQKYEKRKVREAKKLNDTTVKQE